eukprot:14248892-Alexandrium_andersonii.AAC.1
MSASLVGSEMCIRDSLASGARPAWRASRASLNETMAPRPQAPSLRRQSSWAGLGLGGAWLA